MALIRKFTDADGVKRELHARDGYNFLEWLEPFGTTFIGKRERLTVAQSEALIRKHFVNGSQTERVVKSKSAGLSAILSESVRRAASLNDPREPKAKPKVKLVAAKPAAKPAVTTKPATKAA